MPSPSVLPTGGRRTPHADSHHNHTSREMFLSDLQSAVAKAISRPEAREFLRPVADDYAGEAWLQDYTREIRRPMDLGTLHANLQAGVYKDDASQAHADLQLIWTNCIKFNGQGTPMAKQADGLRLLLRLYLSTRSTDILFVDKELEGSSPVTDKKLANQGGILAKRPRAATTTTAPTPVSKKKRVGDEAIIAALRAQVDELERDLAHTKRVSVKVENHADRLELWEVERLVKKFAKLEHERPSRFYDALRILRSVPANRAIMARAEDNEDAEYELDFATMDTLSLRKLETLIQSQSQRCKAYADDAAVLIEVQERISTLGAEENQDETYKESECSSDSDDDSGDDV